MSEWLLSHLGPDVPIHFSAFHPDWKMQDKSATPVNTLIRARNIALDAGMHYVYTGNVHNTEGDSTWCHHCGHRLIGRDWYVITDWNLDENSACRQCGTKPAGVFEAEPGNWGARRLPVRLRKFATQ